jgi:hypothetical protein
MNIVAMTKISCPCWGLSDSLVVQIIVQALYWLTCPGFRIHTNIMVKNYVIKIIINK